jgi:hypothetical protein
MLNLKMLEGMGKTQVLCSTEEQAIEFCEAMWDQYPDLMKPAWKRGQTNWRSETIQKWYVPRIDFIEDEYFQYCQSSNFKQSGYNVVLFEDLLVSIDFGDIPQSEMDMKSLFEIGV